MLVTCAVAQIHGDAVIPTGDRLDGSAHIPNGQNPAASGMRANEVKAPGTGARRAVGGGAPPCRTAVDDYACVGGSCAELRAKPNVAVGNASLDVGEEPESIFGAGSTVRIGGVPRSNSREL